MSNPRAKGAPVGHVITNDIVVLAHIAAQTNPYAAQVVDAIAADPVFPISGSKVHLYIQKMRRDGLIKPDMEEIEEHGGRLLARYTVTDKGRERLKLERSKILHLADIIDVGVPP